MLWVKELLFFPVFYSSCDKNFSFCPSLPKKYDIYKLVHGLWGCIPGDSRSLFPRQSHTAPVGMQS